MLPIVPVLVNLMSELPITAYFLRGSSPWNLSTYVVRHDGHNLNSAWHLFVHITPVGFVHNSYPKALHSLRLPAWSHRLCLQLHKESRGSQKFLISLATKGPATHLPSPPLLQPQQRCSIFALGWSLFLGSRSHPLLTPPRPFPTSYSSPCCSFNFINSCDRYRKGQRLPSQTDKGLNPTSSVY